MNTIPGQSKGVPLPLFDDLGFLNNGIERPTDIRLANLYDRESVYYGSVTPAVPIEISSGCLSSRIMNAIAGHLRPYIQATRMENGKTGRIEIFEPFVQARGNGIFAFVSPTQEILLRQCSVKLERLKSEAAEYLGSDIKPDEPTPKKLFSKREIYGQWLHFVDSEHFQPSKKMSLEEIRQRFCNMNMK